MWLAKELSKEKEAIIFMHHPPILAGVPHMDTKYPLQNRDELVHILYSHPHKINVFCGHYHIAKTIETKNITVNICPSNFYQIDDSCDSFRIAHHNIGFQVISIRKPSIQTDVKWIDTNF